MPCGLLPLDNFFRSTPIMHFSVLKTPLQISTIFFLSLLIKLAVGTVCSKLYKATSFKILLSEGCFHAESFSPISSMMAANKSGLGAALQFFASGRAKKAVDVLAVWHFVAFILHGLSQYFDKNILQERNGVRNGSE